MPPQLKFSENDFDVRKSSIPGAGFGLFSKVRIKIEETIGYYTGEIISFDDLLAGKFSGSDYILALTSKLLIVAEGPKANHMRYINHSTEPNAFLITSNRWKTARLEAIREIFPGDEILFNYGEDYWEADRIKKAKFNL